ncbi:MATE family efflux transporter [Neglecta sp. X4]|uniref:MATE family efflux transporter n=1 Tax=unclassified Neglectibacter TaxID=2632164 RepID=UPI00136E6BA1|nr:MULTISPECIES: MATE family efflux transporter [unclassified Neglectibacter]NBI16569.1 MATE family efflux transporter [Neglectibacter sp. 59]NBJ74089.1 MATE family efflux transporter [Neglectibacter sp. X4]NCE80278.1 MATE family efflux transporter [Neglectibacter sp. X58]
MFQKDLTKGPVFQTMCAFALPMILGNLLQQGYNLVDTWVVGRFVGPGALAAVGSAFALMTFLTSVLLGLCMGSGVVFSLCFGSRNPQRLQSSIASAFALTAALGGLLTACALLGVDRIIRWMNIPGEIAAMAREYLILVFWGIPAIALYNFFGAYLKALGDSVVPLLFLGLSTALNIGLDILLVAVWRQGAAGAAAATVIAQYISGIGIALYTLWKNQPLRQAFKSFRVEKAGLGEIVRYSFLTCLQQSVMNLGILMVQGLVNSFGTTVMAAFAAGVKIDSFAYMPAQEFGNAFSTFIAQNRGAGETGRIKKGVRWGVLTSVSYCLLVSLALWFLAKPLMLIFVDASQTAIIAQGVQYLRIIGPFYCGIGCLFLLYGLYRALGRPAVSVVLTVISLGTRVALSYALSAIPALGVIGIWWSIPIGWALADAAGLLLYQRTCVHNL